MRQFQVLRIEFYNHTSIKKYASKILKIKEKLKETFVPEENKQNSRDFFIDIFFSALFSSR